MVGQSQFLLQDWRNTSVFSQIRQFFKKTPIIAYPSNIIGYLPAVDEKLSAMSSLMALDPVMSLCTNFDLERRIPTRGYIIHDHSEENLRKTLLSADRPFPRP